MVSMTKEGVVSKRTCLLMFVLYLSSSVSSAADSPFVGKWKLDGSKSTFPDQMKVQQVSANKYGFDFEGGGYAETIVADGTDQPGVYGTTFSVTVEGSNSWKVVRKTNGKVLIEAKWKLSQDGSTLADDFTEFPPNAPTFNVYYLYKRTAGGPGFAGTWESVSGKVNSVFEIEMKPYEGDGLSLISPVEGLTLNLKFEGKDKDSPSPTPDVNTKLASSIRQVDALTLELTLRSDGKLVDTRDLKLSPDHKMMTMTVHAPGRTRPEIRVFDREQ
jgi:hypothetical protein